MNIRRNLWKTIVLLARNIPDYELTRYELEEANSLCHGNWIEIERQYKYIQTLQKILSENDIPYPNEYDFWIIIQEGLELFQTLKLAPQVCPSNQTLKLNPQKLAF